MKAQREAQLVSQRDTRATKKVLCPLCLEIIPYNAVRQGPRRRHLKTPGYYSHLINVEKLK
jgi:hypothetical protein